MRRQPVPGTLLGGRRVPVPGRAVAPRGRGIRQDPEGDIREPHPQNAIDLLGKDAIVMTDPGKPPHAYFERFNLNTTTTVLNDPRRRAALVRSVRTVAEVSHELTANPRKYWPALSQAVNAPVEVIAKAWAQFRFPARLDTESLLSVLTDMEPWAASVQERQPRPRAALAGMMDPSVAREAGR